MLFELVAGFSNVARVSKVAGLSQVDLLFKNGTELYKGVSPPRPYTINPEP